MSGRESHYVTMFTLSLVTFSCIVLKYKEELELIFGRGSTFNSLKNSLILSLVHIDVESE